MSQFIFNDIYGNQSARDRYQRQRKYSYFTAVLKIHNKYFENQQMHGQIFSPQKPFKNLLNPIEKPKVPEKFTYYSVEKINNLTFRINKKNRSQSNRNNIPPELTIQSKDSKSPRRDIRKDAEQLKTAIEKSREMKGRNLEMLSTRRKLNHQTKIENLDRTHLMKMHKELKTLQVVP